jgi:CHAD domain-containing protein
MDEQDKQYFDELILKAVQSGKKETSQLVDIVIHRIEPAIEKAIEKYVNGKISTLSHKLDNYIESDNEWKKTAQPVIEMGKNVTGFGKVSLYLLGFVASVSAGFYAIMSFINNKS